jgi:hypothetical protein
MVNRSLTPPAMWREPRLIFTDNLLAALLATVPQIEETRGLCRQAAILAKFQLTARFRSVR